MTTRKFKELDPALQKVADQLTSEHQQHTDVLRLKRSATAGRIEGLEAAAKLVEDRAVANFMNGDQTIAVNYRDLHEQIMGQVKDAKKQLTEINQELRA